MPAPTTPADLLDLKMMPAWVNEPPRTNDYADYKGEEPGGFERERRGPPRGRDARSRGPKPREQGDRPRRPDQSRRPDQQRRPERGPERPRQPQEAPPPLPQVAVRFLPHPAALESVIAQIKSESITYSVFALARLFLDKPERYDVRLTAAEGAVLHQLGENGPVASEQRLLEGNAFPAARDEFYAVAETQTEPMKGNFTNVARCRLSGTLLGPTNHHHYQPQLRSLYEQRFSRRMSFQDYQRQIEIVSDPAVVEQWKEQARSITTYTTKNGEPPITFNTSAEAERHFRQTYLPALLREAPELTISGVVSRRLPDRGLARVIEDAWSAEIRSPSKMMQELAAGLRQAGLNIFRHRRGMLFVSPIRIKTFGHESAAVSPSINAILEKLAEAPGINRKQLAEKIAPAEANAAESDRVKLTLASGLRWLISEGYVIEFNDGTLDLPRAKPPAVAPAGANEPKAKPIEENVVTNAAQPTPRPDAIPPTDDEGSMSVQQSIEPLTPEVIAANDEPQVGPPEKTKDESPKEIEGAPATDEDAVPSPS